MSLYTAAGKAKAARRTGAGVGQGGGNNALVSGSSRPDITDEQKQEIREAFDLFVSVLESGLYSARTDNAAAISLVIWNPLYATQMPVNSNLSLSNSLAGHGQGRCYWLPRAQGSPTCARI